MKTLTSISLFAAAVLLGACKPAEDPAAPPATNSPPSAGQVKQEIKEAASTTLDFLAGTKDQVVEASAKKLAELDAKIEELSNKAGALKDQAKADADPAMEDLRARRQTVGEKLEQMKAGAAEKWSEMKQGFSDAWSEMEKAYERAKEKLSP